MKIIPCIIGLGYVGLPITLNLSKSFQTYGFDNNSKDFINNVQLSNKCLMIFGSESTGLRKLTIKTCDQILKIPQNLNNQFEIESLNVANACSIAVYEYYKIHG